MVRGLDECCCLLYDPVLLSHVQAVSPVFDVYH